MRGLLPPHITRLRGPRGLSSCPSTGLWAAVNSLPRLHCDDCWAPQTTRHLRCYLLCSGNISMRKRVLPLLTCTPHQHLAADENLWAPGRVMPAVRAAPLVLPCSPGSEHLITGGACLEVRVPSSASPACSHPACGPASVSPGAGPALHRPSSVACLEGLSWAPPYSLSSLLHLQSLHMK